jgi:hypothetical protein
MTTGFSKRASFSSNWSKTTGGSLNVNGTINLIEAAKIRKVNKIIFASTEWVYGDKARIAEQKEIAGWLEKPGNFFTDPTRAFATIYRIKTNEINSISDGFNRLYPDQYSARRIDLNAPIGMTESTALNVMDPRTLRILNDIAKTAPGYRPYIIGKPGTRPEPIKDLPAFMAQEDIQKRLNSQQGAQ